MKLLFIHNNYGAYSGEEAVVDRQIALFCEMGHTISVFRKTSEGSRNSFWGNLNGLLQGFYSPGSVKEIKQMIGTDRPDIAIVHNLYPFISPAVLKPLSDAKVPIIMTVHNYRLICPTGLFLQDNKPCERCLGGHEWNCIRYNCENSIPKSIGYAGRNWYARVSKAYSAHVDRYACLTQFQMQKLTEGGFDARRLRLIPNFLEIPERTQPVNQGKYVAISGRLSKEKGIDLVLEVAGKTPDIPYYFAGSQRADEEPLKNLPSNCTFLGHLSKDELQSFYNNASFLVMASRCYEGFPMGILEAASHSKPSIAPAHAGFPEIIDDNHTGLLFTPGDTGDLLRQVARLWNEPETCTRMGATAFDKLKTTYSVEVIRHLWNDCFSELI